MNDFTIKVYEILIKSLKEKRFVFRTFADFMEKPEKKGIILRHDVDRLPENSLIFAKMQADWGIKGTYYFRVVPESWDDKIILQVAELGHEVGYHYEDLSFAQAKLKAQDTRRKEQGEEIEREIVKIGIESFNINLESLRKIVPVKTICMHGSPLSRWDSRLLWKYYDYRDFGIIGEPYFDIDFNEVFYLTDTGRRWDGNSFNIRDKAQGSLLRAKEKSTRLPITVPIDIGNRLTFPKFRTTLDIIHATEAGKLPDKIMMTFHPQRWTDNKILWIKELAWQNVKNAGKYFLKKARQVR